MIEKDTLELYELIVALHEGDITEEQFARLNEKLKQKDSVRRYVEFVSIFSGLSCPSEVDVYFDRDKDNGGLKNDNQDAYTVLMKKFAEEEMTAPTIQTPKQEPKPVLIQKVEYPRFSRRKKLSKWEIGSLITAAAAVVFMILFIRFAPPKGGIEVATLTDSMNAKWVGVAGSMEKGTRLTTRSDKLFLREGLAKLVFDNNAKVVIEGPAEFSLLAEDRIDLRHGRIYMRIPREAIGFTVSTPTSRIIDLGTEFGVQADVFGNVQLHVIKGKTTLIAGDKSNRVHLQVSAGQAKKISGSTQSISDIPCETELFVRDISSDKKYIWNGRMEINLANLVAGGIEFTQGHMSSGIDPATGAVHSEAIQKYDRLGQGSYKSVPDRQFIDGVFVPNGAHGKNVVSTTDYMFAFPETNGEYYADITSNPYVLRAKGTGEMVPVFLTSAEAENPTDPVLVFVHPNAGMTFNLDEIRQSLPPHLKIDRFTALCGVSKGVEQFSRSEFWILVDGVCVFHHLFDANNSGAGEIEIPIKPDQKFLTLAATDGGDGISMDWCVFDQPTLHLEVSGK